MKVICSTVLAFLALAPGSLLVAQTRENPEPPRRVLIDVQTPRQAVIEMLSGNPDKLNRHLTLAVQERFKVIMRNAPAGSPNPIQAMMVGFNSKGQSTAGFESGPILFCVNNPETNQRIEFHLDADEFRGEEDEMEVSVHSYRDGAEEHMPVHMHFVLAMKLQQGIWRLDALTISARLPLGDPQLFDKSTWMPQMMAGNLPEDVASLTGEAPKPKITPIRAVRRMALAENIYAQKHPEQGFTCAIPNLVNVGNGIDEGEMYKFVDPEFASGVYNGYRFAIRGCEGKPSKGFQVVAEPINGKGRAYCSDDRLNLRSADDGRGTTCLSSGRIARN